MFPNVTETVILVYEVTTRIVSFH